MSLRVGIQGWGSEGDLAPLVALAARLAQAGHAPRLVLTPVDGKDYTPLCARSALPLTLVPEQAPVTLQELVRDAKSANPTKLMNAVLERTFYTYLEAMYQAALALCRASDVVIGGSSSWVLKAAALATNVPFVSLHYYPGIVPSRLVPPPIFPNWRILARPGWALLGLLMDLAFRGPARAFFAAKGLPPIRHALPDVLFSERLNLLAASPTFYPPVPDWSPAFCVTGELRMPSEFETWQPSSELAAFLAAGEKPVLMSLGSMEHMAPQRARTLLIESARRAGVRAIVQSKASTEEGADGALYFLPWAPHARLARYCSAFVHHGGAGTSHAALRAGLPSIVVPFIFEQGLWAKRLRQLGAARKARSFWRTTPAQLARELRATLADPELSRNAVRAASAMASEDGAGQAIRRLEQLLA